MNIKKHSLSFIFLALAIFTLSSGAQAAAIPTFVMSQMNNNTQVQLTIINADPNASATLYYPTNGSYSQLNIGLTNGTGYLTYNINPTAYNVTSGALAYVIVNGAQSQTQVWPVYSASSPGSVSGSLSLSQNNITLSPGQSTVISVSSGTGSVGTVTVPSNINPSVATAAISNNQITVNGVGTGSTIMTVCASNVGCVTLYVSVQQSSSSNTSTTISSSAISFSQSTVSLVVGQSQTVTLSGPGSYYISGSFSSNVASASLSGSALTVTALNAGSATLNVCGSSNNTSSCGTIMVSVTGTNSGTGTNQSTISFSQSDVSLSLGEARNVTVSGSGLGTFYISNNSNSSIVGANLVGNNISLNGNSSGGANITVCQFGGTCKNLYAYVNQNGTNSSTATPTIPASNQPLSLSSFGIASNNVNGSFLSTGAALTFTFSSNQALANPTLVVGAQTVPLYGTGSGPYTGIYTLTGAEVSPLPVAVTIRNSAGASTQTAFSLGKASLSPIPSVVADTASSFNSGSQIFTQYLEVGSTGVQVTALQTRLTALGFYSGPITGKFGALTEVAVKKYQAKHAIAQLGAVGPATRALLNSGK